MQPKGFFFIESNLMEFLGFSVTFGLRNVHRGEGRWSKVSILLDNFLQNYVNMHPNASVYVYPKGIFYWIKINWILGGFVVTLGLRNCHMGGEVKWTFLKN